MPWDVKKRGSRYCVIKEGESRPVPGGCHPTRSEAVRHQRALYASERRSGKASSSSATVSAVPTLENGWTNAGHPEPAASAREAAEIMTRLAKAAIVTADPDYLESIQQVPVTTGSSATGITFTAATSTAPALTEEEYKQLATIKEVVGEDEDEAEAEDAEEDEDEEMSVLQWEGILAVEGMPTDDGRYLIPGEIGEREPMPRPLQVQFATGEGHGGAVTVGGIDTVSHIPIADFEQEDFDLEDVPDGAIVIWARATSRTPRMVATRRR